MVYNSNTPLQNFGQNADMLSKTVADTDRQRHADAFDNNAAYKDRIMEKTLNNTLDPYTDVYLMHRRPGYSVAYGPGENPYERERGHGLMGGFQEAMQKKYQSQPGIIQVTDPLGRSTFGGGFAPAANGEFSLMQLQQTMGELKNRAAIETTAAFNRHAPPASRVNRLTQPENIMEKLLPGMMQDARTKIIKSTILTTATLENPYKNSSSYGMYYDMDTRRWFQEKGAEPYPGPPELIEDAFAENNLWKQNMYHGPDYAEGPSSKDKTKEIIKTASMTGTVVTTGIGDKVFKKNKEFEAAETGASVKQKKLQEMMDNKKKSGFLLGIPKE